MSLPQRPSFCLRRSPKLDRLLRKSPPRTAVWLGGETWHMKKAQSCVQGEGALAAVREEGTVTELSSGSIRRLRQPDPRLEEDAFGRGAVMDWFSRRVLSWRSSITMEADFCVDAER